jgi:hypothetical protein
MEVKYINKKYGDNTKIDFDTTYDYCLYRQDWGGCELVYFDFEELDDLFEKINDGDIAIHYNYSVLLCKDKDVLDKTPQENIWWYVTTIDKFI